jgi:hypothetical protein
LRVRAGPAQGAGGFLPAFCGAERGVQSVVFKAKSGRSSYKDTPHMLQVPQGTQAVLSLENKSVTALNMEDQKTVETDHASEGLLNMPNKGYIE